MEDIPQAAQANPHPGTWAMPPTVPKLWSQRGRPRALQGLPLAAPESAGGLAKG